ncbi:hypothetical protein JQ506_18150 [Shinella sp. PSBB067]|uniref:hypothetical protein n=1 Tax=Shinella sp. PSBB067 TaxID=2715959 RepID=UPI00193B622A|nr:hypothetical protein [Shinella sp. PSBB067]QRI62737.1 hypothetical protein JQ506_18150 [Shinella sp. PSBB067]
MPRTRFSASACAISIATSSPWNERRKNAAVFEDVMARANYLAVGLTAALGTAQQLARHDCPGSIELHDGLKRMPLAFGSAAILLVAVLVQLVVVVRLVEDIAAVLVFCLAFIEPRLRPNLLRPAFVVILSAQGGLIVVAVLNVRVIVQQVSVLEMIAVPVLHSDKCSIFDVSALLPKLPKNDISAFSLRDLVLPGDETIYVHFGREEALIVDHAQDLYFEGAYVTQADEEIGDDEVSTFRMALVFSDPEFGGLAFDRPIGQTLKRNSDFVRFEIKHTNSVRQGFASLAQNGLVEESQVLTAPLKVYRAAYDLLIRSMIYLGQEGRDLEPGYFDGAPERQLRKALNGDENSEHYLLESGFPAVQFVGRNIEPIPDLSEPDWGAEPVGFRI